MIIETERLKIYTASQDEMTRFIDKQSDEILKAAYLEMLDGALNHPKDWQWYAIWMIELKDGTHIGEMSFKGLNEDGSVEIGYGISEKYRGCGYATEALSAIVTWALKQTGVSRVEAETEAANIASEKVLEKCGFVPSGIVGKEGPRYLKML